MTCIVPGCKNEVVRVFIGATPKMEGACFGVCAFHGVAIIRYGTDEQVRGYLFPASGGKEAKP